LRDLPPLIMAATAEFPFGAGDWLPGMDRREFLRLMGASLALGGVSGCVRPTGDTLVPYVAAPEEALPGRPKYYATAVPVEGFARGILVETHLGRPTKIEGNPDHPESRGATDAITQAAILDLYDPDRSCTPLRRGEPSTWTAFADEWGRQREIFAGTGGRGLALLTEPTTSPTLLRELEQFRTAFPGSRWYQHTALADYAPDGWQFDYDLGRARVILAIGSDCLFRHPACLRYARSFAKLRRVEQGQVPRSRLYVIESTPTLTGAMADVRLPASPTRLNQILDGITEAMGADSAGEGAVGPAVAVLSPDERSFIRSLARDWRLVAPEVLCVAGDEQGSAIRRWSWALNERGGAVGHTVTRRAAVRSDGDPRSAGGATALAAALRGGEVKALVIVSANPIYTSPEIRDLADSIHRLPFSAHLGSHADETAAVCRWHLPEAHFLETWGDLRGFDGTPSVMQPLIEPLYGGRSALEVLHALHAPTATGNGYDLVRETWRQGDAATEFELRWASALRRGRMEERPAHFGGDGVPGRVPSPSGRPDADRSTDPFVLGAHAPVGMVAEAAALAGKEEGATAGLAAAGWTLVLMPDPNVGDGRGSNNAWLQELPRPLTQLVWDNAALISPAMAEALGIANGDVLALSTDAARVEAAAWIVPGHAPGCVSMALGYGRTRAGFVGTGRGFDAYPLRRGSAGWTVRGLRIARTDRRYPLVTTQRHFTMEGREPVRVVPSDRIAAPPPDPTTTLYSPVPPGAHAWGMSIDLGTCLGCNACVVACQSENNTPVVGKDQVARGREMHWIRIDRYFEGDPAAPRLLHQPVPCMQCENAPCEVVCPVGATVHSSEGLNQMVYNRCVGTRYCSNNCPYKVRRFNFLDYRSPTDSPVNLQKNPDVTVRARGVMEKCTYCVQRINRARIDAAEGNRPIRDGEVRTACQQACPVEAIVFGDLADPSSQVSRRKREPANYSLLGELNTRPRTTYLPKVIHVGFPAA